MGVWQLAETPRDRATRLELLEEAVAAAAAARAELMVTPELALADPRLAPRSLVEAAEPCDGSTLVEVGRIAGRYRVGLVVGYAEACSGRVHSSAIVVAASGEAVGNYRRTHVRGSEEDDIARGAWLSIVPVNGRRIGVFIGYDVLFPEPARALVLAGADLLVALGGGPDKERPWIERLLPARAAENGAPIAYAEPDLGSGRLGGGSRILDGRGDSLDVAAAGAGVRVAEVPRPDTTAAMLLSDRRPRLYHGLAVVDGEPRPPATSRHALPRAR